MMIGRLRVIGGRLRTLLLFYKRHLRVQPLRELMAIVGVAAGVALLFAVQVSHRSITGSFESISHGLAGNATLEMAARGPAGFDQRIGEEVEGMPGVRAVAPVLGEPIVAIGPRGRRALTLIGATEQISPLHGTISTRFQRAGESSHSGLLVLTEATAHAIGARPGEEVTILVAGRRKHLALDAIVPSSDLGSASAIPIAAAPLPIVQSIAGEPERVTRVLIQAQPGREHELQRALSERYGATLNARPLETEARLLGAVAAPEDDITLLFGAVSVLAGMILAYNALLLAGEERRRFIAFLVQIGTPDGVIVASLMFDALMLGLAGCALGLLAGDAISLIAYRSPPGYIAAAFDLGAERVVGSETVLLALGCGLLAALAAAGLPALAVLRSSAVESEPGRGALERRTRRRIRPDALACACGMTLACVSVAVSLLSAALTIAGVVGFAAGLVLCLPVIARRLLERARVLASRWGDPCARLAVAELRGARTRAVALLATGTVAAFLLVVIGGAVTDVHTAVRRGATDLLASATLWVRPGGPENVYSTQPFAYASAQRRLARLDVVSSVLVWRDSFLDLPGVSPGSPGRRVWVLGAPPQVPDPIAPSQLVHGSLSSADEHLREGGWAALSQAIASEHHVRIGQSFQLPTPTGHTRLRLAATLANYGSMQGALMINGTDDVRLWDEPNSATELAVTLRPGVSSVQGKRAVQAALEPGSALNVATASERRSEADVVLASSLSRLNDTTIVVLIATIASVIALMLAAVSQRRARLDSLSAIGMSAIQLARLIFYESALALLAGFAIGTIAGLAGQYLIDVWLQYDTGSAVHYAPAWQIGLRTTAIILAITLATSLLALARGAAAGSQPHAAFVTE